MKRDFKGVWIPVEIWTNRNLSLQEKVFLVEIHSLSTLEKGCFASNAYFAEFFNISKQRASKVILSLEEKNLIKIKLKYKGKQITKRIIKITNQGVSIFLDRGVLETRGGILESSRVYTKVYTNNNTINNTSKYHSQEPDGSVGSIKKINGNNSLKEKHQKELEPYLKLATKLSKIIKTQKDVKHTLPQLKSWSVDIKKLTTQNKIPKKRIKEVLNWYKDNIGGEFIPVVESGKTLFEKFDKLENAIKREQTNKNKSNNKTTIGYRRKDNHQYKTKPDIIL